MATLNSKAKNNIKQDLSQHVGLACWYCGIALTKQVGAAQATLDHKLPQSKGGSSRKDNFYLCCNFCNGARRNMPVAQFLEWLNFVKQNNIPSVVLPTGALDFSLRKHL